MPAQSAGGATGLTEDIAASHGFTSTRRSPDFTAGSLPGRPRRMEQHVVDGGRLGARARVTGDRQAQNGERDRRDP